MIKVLWYSDFLVPTGFGNVAEEILSRLYATGKYQFTVLGINYDGTPYNIPDSPYYHLRDLPVHPAEYMGDMFGRQRLLNFLSATKVDILFVLQDTFNMAALDKPLRAIRAAKGWKYVFYFPVDGELDKEWVHKGVATADYPIAYTKYGLEQVQTHDESLRLPVMYHGVDRSVFYPLTEEERQRFRKEFLGATSKDFVVTNVNRNTSRKDIPRTICAWQRLKREIGKTKLYLHTDILDPVGYDLERFIQQHVPPEDRDDIYYPESKLMQRLGMPKQAMRSVYGMSDVVVSTTLGEGWGMSTTEAMACGVPVVMPRNTSSVEIIGEKEQRGWLADCDNHFVLRQHDNYQLRPLTSVQSLIDRMVSIRRRPKTARKRAAKAMEWIVKNCDWDKIAERWDEVFTTAYEARALRRVED